MKMTFIDLSHTFGEGVAEQIHGKQFRVFAVPVKAEKVAAMPVRALAEIDG
jgi:kynurenine formamidase